MSLSQVTVNWDFSAVGTEAVICLLVLGGALFLLSMVVWGDNPVSSGPALRKKFMRPQDSLDPVSSTEGPAGQDSQASRKPAHRSERGRDKRRSLRRGGNPVPVLITDSLNTGEPLQGLVLNRSRGGLFLSVPRKIEVGRVLALRTPDFPDLVASVHVRVRHCKQRGEAWRIGCQFMEELPWSVLLLFG
jgi:hypothetical protein